MLRAFLERYRQGEPPLVLSDGFPGDMLPRPLLPEIVQETAAPSLEERRERFRLGKQFRSRASLSSADFVRAMQGEPIMGEGPSTPITTSAVLKNSIDRNTGTTGEVGGLFNFDEQRWPSITVYVLAAPDFVKPARRLFAYLADTGFGKRKTVGYGSVALRAFEPCDGLPSFEAPNAFVSLSSFVPASGDPVDGFWRTRVKYGKLGEELAVSENPFKRPFVQLIAGSVFYDSPVRPWYGRMVSGLNPAHPEVVQCGLALALPVHMEAVRTR